MVVKINRELFTSLYKKADESPRGRTNYNLHKPEDTCQRFFNVIKCGSYMRPHKHDDDETFIIIRGNCALIVFDDEGKVTNVYNLSTILGNYGVHVPAGIWHTLFVISEYTVLMEIKPGPYDPKTAKEFAPWAPEKGAEGQLEYMDRLCEELSGSI